MTNQNGHICRVCHGDGCFQDAQGGWWDCPYCDATGITTPTEKAWWKR